MKTTAIKAARVLLWLIYAWVIITLVLLLLAFLLQLLGADPTAGFVEWVYRATERAMAPFRGIFESIELSDESVLDVSILFAMIVYGFVALGLNVALDWVTRRLAVAEYQEHEQAAYAAATAPAHRVHVVGPTGVSVDATLTQQAWGTAMDVSAFGLDPAGFYSVWLEGSGGGRVSAATFQPSETGAVKLSMTTSVLLRDSQTFGLSLLPRPGELGSTDLAVARLA